MLPNCYTLYAFQKILDEKADLPATMVNPTAGKVYWIMDKEASSKLNSV